MGRRLVASLTDKARYGANGQQVLRRYAIGAGYKTTGASSRHPGGAMLCQPREGRIYFGRELANDVFTIILDAPGRHPPEKGGYCNGGGITCQLRVAEDIGSTDMRLRC
jgi:hypothetical protein